MTKLLSITFMLSVVLFAIACKKTTTPVLSPTLTYRLTDTVYYVMSSMTGTITVTGSSPATGQVSVKWILVDSTLIIDNKDSFTNSQGTYVPKGSVWPVVGFRADSISFSTKLGGIGTQSWYVVYGKKM